MVLAVLAAVLGGTLTSICAPVPSASASLLPPTLYLPLAADTSFGSADGTKVLIESRLTLHAGERRRVFARMEAFSSGYAGWLGVGVRCLDAAGQQSGPAAWIGTNHQGVDGPYTPAGHVTLYPALLFTAPTSGSYTCQLAAENGTSQPNGRVTALQNGSGPALRGTGLQISSTDEPGAQWWQNPDCDSSGIESTCRYLSGAAGDELGIFQNDGTPLRFWTAAKNATAASASATVELTTCYGGTQSCTQRGGPGGSTVSTHLELDQLRPDGLGVCRVNRTPDAVYTVSGAAHHDAIPFELTVPVSATCGGSRLFELFVYIKRVSGNPIKIDGTRPGPAAEAETAAFAFNSAFNTTTTVPNVLGTRESAARDTITAAGLAVGTVSYVDNPASPGTVVGQNSPAATVEPIDSPVALIVSGRPVTVPDVVTETLQHAVADIHAAGLTLGIVSHVNTCIDPGSVQTQNPTGGATVLQGSAVNLTISAPTPGCQPK